MVDKRQKQAKQETVESSRGTLLWRHIRFMREDGEKHGLRLSKITLVDRYVDALMMFSAKQDGVWVVAFHTANTPEQALLGGLQRWTDGKLKFRRDEFKEEREAERD